MKRQPTDWEKIFAKWPIRGQPPKYTNSSCSSITTTKRAKQLNRHFSKKDIQTANRHIYDAQDHQYNKVSSHTGQNVCMLSHFSHVWLCDPMGCSLWGSSVHGILQARILEWVPISSSGDVPDPGIEPASLTFPALAGKFFTTSTTRGEGNGTPLQYSCLENPMGGGAW